MTVDNQPTLRCPLCGEEMHLGYAFTSNIEGHKRKWRYYCKCGLWFPLMDTPEEALSTAQKRWQEPNRVLTLGEVQVLAYAEYEQQHVLSVEYRAIIKGAENVFRPCVIAHESLSMVGILELYDGANMKLMEKSMYGKRWRCWLRNPSAEEMSTTPWREK